MGTLHPWAPFPGPSGKKKSRYATFDLTDGNAARVPSWSNGFDDAPYHGSAPADGMPAQTEMDAQHREHLLMARSVAGALVFLFALAAPIFAVTSFLSGGIGALAAVFIVFLSAVLGAPAAWLCLVSIEALREE